MAARRTGRRAAGIHLFSDSAGAAAVVSSVVGASVEAVSVAGSAGVVSATAADESAVVVVSSSAMAAVVSHPKTRETRIDAILRFIVNPLFAWLKVVHEAADASCAGVDPACRERVRCNQHAMKASSHNQALSLGKRSKPIARVVHVGFCCTSAARLRRLTRRVTSCRSGGAVRLASPFHNAR